MDDEKIIDLIYNRCEEGLTELKNKYNDLLFTISMAILKNTSDTEESVNDTYMKVWETVPPTLPNYLKAFISKIIRNISINRYRKRAILKDREAYLEDFEYEISSSKSIEDDVFTSELNRDIDKFLDSIDTKVQILFLRRYFLGEDIKSLAKRFNLTPNYVSVNLNRVKAKLQVYLEERGYKIYD